MIYNYYKDYQELPINKPIWAFAYSVDNNNTAIKHPPVLGEIIIKTNGPHQPKFVSYKEGTTEKSKERVFIGSRIYADTYEEAVEEYNKMVQERVMNLETMLLEARTDTLC